VDCGSGRWQPVDELVERYIEQAAMDEAQADVLRRNCFQWLLDQDVATLQAEEMMPRPNDAALDSLSRIVTNSGADGGSPRASALVAGGGAVPLTDANKQRFIRLWLHRKLVEEAEEAARWVAAGLDAVVPLPAVRGLLRSAADLQLALSGTGMDAAALADLRAHTSYRGLAADSELVGMFWGLAGRMSPTERGRLLRFATGLLRRPAAGFGSLGQRFCLELNTAGGLPKASTCGFTLLLPPCDDAAELGRMLAVAVEHGLAEGFLNA
jgi:hypothetical protein